MKSIKILLIALLGLLLIVGCEDTKNDDNAKDIAEWIGTWLSAGDNVSVILATYFAYDSVRVELTEDGVVNLSVHTEAGGWVESTGVFAITESEDGDIHAFWADYTTYEQEGIIQVTDDTMQLEVVQTVPDLGATVPTVDGGFGADPTLGTWNIQTYVREE